METKDLVQLLENNDALGFTKFLKEALKTETDKQLAEGALTPIMPCPADCTKVHNHHKAEETDAGHKAGDATTQTTATDPSKKATPAMGNMKPLAEQIEELKGQVQKALSESNTADAAKFLTALDEALVNKAKEDEIAASKAAGGATSKTTGTDPTKTATPAMPATKPLEDNKKGGPGKGTPAMPNGKPEC
jgi:hypothetical protein